MTMLRSVTAGAVAAAMLATSAAPAMAQGYPGGYGSYGRPTYGPGPGFNGNRYRGHRDNTGAIVAGVVGVGILAAILASASKSNRNQDSGYNNNSYGSIRSDNDAADACAAAAERQSGGNARTRSIDTVDAVGNAAYNVRGTVSVASNGYDDRDARGFNCTVRQGSVQRIDFGGYAYGY